MSSEKKTTNRNFTNKLTFKPENKLLTYSTKSRWRSAKMFQTKTYLFIFAHQPKVRIEIKINNDREKKTNKFDFQIKWSVNGMARDTNLRL